MALMLDLLVNKCVLVKVSGFYSLNI